MNVPKIMAIDDDMEMLKQLAVMLGDQYAVSVITSATQALEMLRKRERPDLILLDVMMPETDGFSLMEHLQHNPELNRIPVIFLTAMTDTKSIPAYSNSAGSFGSSERVQSGAAAIRSAVSMVHFLPM